ncbi:MAG: tetratricopeptide repeat protein, partial [Huintestinicola sp.]
MKKRVKKLIKDGKYEEASAIAEKCLGNFELDEAEEIYNAIYDKVTDEEGRDSSEAIYCLRHLAEAAYQRGNYSLALSMNNTVLEWFDSNDNINSSDALLTMYSIADIYEIHNRFDDEYEICSKAFSISLENDNENEYITRLLLKQLADCCVSLGKYDEGLSYYDHLLRIYEENEAAYYEETALVYDGMGYAYKYKGMPLRSKQCFEEGIALLETYLQKDSTNLLMMLNDLCSLYDILSMLDEALELRRSVFERAKKLYGFDHPNVIVAKSNLADAYSDIGDYNTAIRLYEECYRWSIENLDPSHREITRIKRCLSENYLKLGFNEKALSLSEEVYRTYC